MFVSKVFNVLTVFWNRMQFKRDLTMKYDCSTYLTYIEIEKRTLHVQKENWLTHFKIRSEPFLKSLGIKKINK